MAVQYHYNIACKRISDAGWVTTMKAEHGEIPMSIVQPRSEVEVQSQVAEVSGTLTTEPLVQNISDTSVVTAYLRGLNRRPDWELAWHNDAVIWNLSLRLGKMEIGQEAIVRISYFSNKGIGAGIYEIKLIDVHSEEPSTKGPSKESAPSSQPSAVVTPPKDANKPSRHPFSSSTPENRQGDSDDDGVTQLTKRVENLQDQLMMVRKTLHQALDRIERLETGDRVDSSGNPTTSKSPPTPTRNLPDTTKKQPAEVSDETVLQADDIEADTDEPNLFEYLAQSHKKSTTTGGKSESAGNDNVKGTQKKH
ncbi:MAG: hypothetical protein OXN17_13765 [Candidatus Poribacteria bacterium]|nr:hypothetical protein [Candidatus Poribacteria bacterium]MDE0504708.1 hypothetical protein [Candidatus Poribacteria bacterium]